MRLFSYYRSSASYRVRIALGLKGLPFDYAPVNLVNKEQRSEDYTQRNPIGLVPTLELGSGEALTQSMAILEWLEETHPEPPLLPTDPLERARVRSAAQAIASDIQPICNLSILQYLDEELGADEDAVLAWQYEWMHRGFRAFESAIASSGTSFCFGSSPGLADIVLIPQVYNATRWRLPLDEYPTISRIVEACNQLPAFVAAMPERQPDFPKD